MILTTVTPERTQAGLACQARAGRPHRYGSNVKDALLAVTLTAGLKGDKRSPCTRQEK